MIVLDVECYKDYLLIAFKEVGKNRTRYFEMYPGQQLDKSAIAGTMASHTTISFNGLGYDLLIITAALQGYGNKALKALSDKIIKTRAPAWMLCRDNHIDIPTKWNHIDIMEVAPGTASLKVYGGRLGVRKMQDLPVDPSASISAKLRPLMQEYCFNDLVTTEHLYKKLEPAIELRINMGQQYKMDLRSKSDAQMAETIIKSELTRVTGKTYRKPNKRDIEGRVFRYQNPTIISFQTPRLSELFERILSHKFTVSAAGKVQLPTWLSASKIKIGDGKYKMGIGGLHSTEKNQLVEAGNGILCDLDVSSYYPAIILQQRLAPKSMGVDFLRVYQAIVTRRLHAKKLGDKTTADGLKISVNGSFGKLGNIYSTLYSPDLLLQTTITGQLALLMLIERLEIAGIRVVSANTDGVVCKAPKQLERDIELVGWDWSLDTSFNLERTNYKRLASRDVNNYLAVKLDGTTKGKGCFGAPGLQKNPDRSIVFEAVKNAIVGAKDNSANVMIARTIRGCSDIQKFVTVRKVAGGGVFNGEWLGKSVRFYKSNTVGDDASLQYAINGHKVAGSSGCRPIMDLPDKLPGDIDFEAYRNDAMKLLGEVGYET